MFGTRIHQHIRSNVVGYVAVFIALSGSAWAAGTVGPKQIKRNAVRSKQVKNHSLKGVDIAPGAIGSAEVADGALTGDDIRDGSILGKDLGTHVAIRFGGNSTPGSNGTGVGCVDGTPGGSTGVNGGAACGAGAGGASSITAQCLPGERAIAGGYSMDNRHALVTDSHPSPLTNGATPTGWRVDAVSLTSTAGLSTTVTPYVICTDG